MSPFGSAADCAAHLTQDGIAWMWSDELPSDYRETRIAGAYFSEPRFPVMLHGSREVMYRDSRGWRCRQFVKRAAQMLRYSSGDDAKRDAIMARAQKMFPRVRDSWDLFGDDWIGGRRVDVADAPSSDLYMRLALVRDIRRTMRDIAKLEKQP